MRLACQQADLSRALNIVNRAVAAKPTLPILSNVLLTAQEGRLVLTGYDLEIGIRTEVPVTGDALKTQRSLAVPAKLLLDMVNSFGEGELTLDLTDNHDVVLAGPRGHYTLRGLPAEDYPDFPSFDGDGKEAPKSFQVVVRDLLGGLKRTIFATARDSGRAFTSGVYFQTEEDHLVLVATDGRRLALDKVPIANRDGLKKKEHNALLPAANMDDVLQIIPLVAGDDALVTFAFTPKLARISVGPVEVITHLLDAAFPPYEKAIPREFKGKILMPRDEFLRTIRQVAVVARQKEGRDLAILSTDGDELTIQARVDNLGDARYVMETDKAGDEMRIAFNYQNLIDPIAHVDNESVELNYSGQLDPGVMRSPGSPHYIYVLMPVRLSD
ncbi:MAG: DNA polymerase III subunit beta [bacterium]